MATTRTSPTRTAAAAAGAKLPEDRAAKAEANDDLIHVTVRGFDFEFNPELLDDDDILSAMERGIPDPLLTEISSPEQLAEIKKSLRVDGKLKRSAVLEFAAEVMQEMGEGNA
jgi:hypothetical protein